MPVQYTRCDIGEAKNNPDFPRMTVAGAGSDWRGELVSYTSIKYRSIKNGAGYCREHERYLDV